MFKLIIVHFISDFLLQRRVVGVNKSSNWLAMAEHICIIFLCFLPFGVEFAACNALIHMLIDKNIWTIYKYIRRDENKKTFKYWEDHLFYSTIGFDQLLHIATLIFLNDYL